MFFKQDNKELFSEFKTIASKLIKIKDKFCQTIQELE